MELQKDWLNGENGAKQVRHLVCRCRGWAAPFQNWGQTKAAGCANRACVSSFSCPTSLGFSLPSDLQLGLHPSPRFLEMGAGRAELTASFESRVVFTLCIAALRGRLGSCLFINNYTEV